jgi:predicted alpha/beta-fold hydrolase
MEGIVHNSTSGDPGFCRGWLSGHVWTIAPAMLAGLQPPAGPPAKPFETVLHDAALGAVRLSGLHSEIADSENIVLIVHGLSGNALSPYCARAASAATRAGFSSLRLSLRGADYSGEDIFHGGTTEDLRAALATPEMARYKRVLLIGYSVGGHIALRAAIDPVDPRLRAAVAVCPPLDLSKATAAFDRPERRFYRRHIFRSLNKAYAAAAARGRAPNSTAVVERARSCRERDSLTVVPRFSFRSAADYYERESVAPRLHRLRIPSLVVAARHDPIIPSETISSAVAGASPALRVVWTERGGHVGFPPDLELGQSGPLGFESQVLVWLASQ